MTLEPGRTLQRPARRGWLPWALAAGLVALADEIVEVPDTQDASSPFFSPDGRWVAFFGGGKLKKVAVSGGTPVAVADGRSSRGGVWLEDDTIVYSPDFSSGLVRVPASGGDPVALTTLDPDRNERTHRWPARLPDGRGILFMIGTLDNPGAYDDAVIARVDLETGVVSRLVEGAGMAEFADGKLYYARRGELLAVDYDPAAEAVTAAPVVVLKGVDGEPTSGNADFMFTRSGTLVYMPQQSSTNAPDLVAFDRDGRSETLPIDGRGVLTPSLSRDGRSLALTIGPGLGDGDIWIYDLASRRNRRLTVVRYAAGGASTSARARSTGSAKLGSRCSLPIRSSAPLLRIA